MGADGTPLPRHLLRIIVLALVGLAVIRLMRALTGTATERRDPDQGPVIGSVDTWPAVPRSPAKAANGPADAGRRPAGSERDAVDVEDP